MYRDYFILVESSYRWEYVIGYFFVVGGIDIIVYGDKFEMLFMGFRDFVKDSFESLIGFIVVCIK